MTNSTTLSIFVDESGNLPLAGTNSRFYIVSLVAHNQQESIDKPVRELDEAFARMGLPNLCFHAGPLIRREDGYKYMAQLKVGISEFLDAANLHAVADFKIKVYYDCGQSVIMNLIHESMTARHGDNWEFAQDVRPGRYRLLQVADLVSFVSLIEQKRQSGIGLTKSEEKFFGGARNFKRNVLKPILRKKI